MNYIYTTSTDSAASYLIKTIKAHITRGETVLWLLSGGSAISTAVAVSKQLKDIDTTKLAITLVDERFGPVGHPDENWLQLLNAGFDLPTAQLYRPLIGADRHKTAQAFGQWVAEHAKTTDYSIGLFGIGADGHTAGLKPGFVSGTEPGWTTDFTGTDYERISLTFQAIKQLNEAVVQAMGTDKAETLDTLLHSDIAVDIQPAQILKSIQQSTLFTDYKEI